MFKNIFNFCKNTIIYTAPNRNNSTFKLLQQLFHKKGTTGPFDYDGHICICFVQRAIFNCTKSPLTRSPINNSGLSPLQQLHLHTSCGILLAIQSNRLFGSWPNSKRGTVLVLWLWSIATKEKEKKKASLLTRRNPPTPRSMSIN